MPYERISDLPTSQVDQYDHHQKEAFRKAFNHAYHEYGGDESRAFAVAHAAAKRADSGGHGGGSGASGGGRGGSSRRAGGGKVNVNRASAEELMEVSGIGERTARHIVDYRARHGRFRSLDELEEVEGIGASTLRDIRGGLAT